MQPHPPPTLPCALKKVLGLFPSQDNRARRYAVQTYRPEDDPFTMSVPDTRPELSGTFLPSGPARSLPLSPAPAEGIAPTEQKVMLLPTSTQCLYFQQILKYVHKSTENVCTDPMYLPSGFRTATHSHLISSLTRSPPPPTGLFKLILDIISFHQ